MCGAAIMTLGRRRRGQQQEFWIANSDVCKGPGHPFYRALNRLLADARFDDHVERICAPYYAKVGQNGLAPGIYFRMLFIGYFEGISSERGIDWRCADSFSLREFLGIALDEQTPDHSTLGKTRKRLPLETHADAFSFVLALLARQGLLRGEGIAIDASNLHANASMESLVRNDTGESYDDFLARLAQASGIETPTRADLKRFDRKRKQKKTSNKEWHNPHDPDAKIAKTPKAGTRLTYKAENAVDTASGAIVSAQVHTAEKGDTTTGPQTLDAANEELGKLVDACPDAPLPADRVVADKGYHSGAVLDFIEDTGWTPVISEPDRGRRKWIASDGTRKDGEQEATYRNRRRLSTQRGKRLLRRRAEKVERSFAHLLDCGGLRRVYVRGLENVRKRYTIHAAAFNLGVLMRNLTGIGKPRVLQTAPAAVSAALQAGMLYILWIWLGKLSAALHQNSNRRSFDPRHISAA